MLCATHSKLECSDDRFPGDRPRKCAEDQKRHFIIVSGMDTARPVTPGLVAVQSCCFNGVFSVYVNFGCAGRGSSLIFRDINNNSSISQPAAPPPDSSTG